MASTTTLILGAGFGGLTAARTLRALLPGSHRIVVVDRDPHFRVGATFPWVMMGKTSLDEVTASRAALLPAGVDLVLSDITAIDPGKARVHTTSGELRADAMVIALGIEPDMNAIPGLAEGGHTFFTAAGATRAAPAVRDFKGGDLVVLVSRAPFKCPPAPYETAMSLHYELMEGGILGATRLSVRTIEPAPMPTAGPEMGALIRGELERRGIAYHPKQKCVAVHPGEQTIEFEGGERAHYDLLLAVPPHVAPAPVRDAGLVNASGWIPVNPQSLELTESDAACPCYAIGDVAVLPLPGYFDARMPLALPKAGVFAAAQGEVVAGEIAARVLGRDPTTRFDGRGFCFLETGGAMALRADGSFFDLPHPRMQREPPSTARFREKQEWVRGWLGG